MPTYALLGATGSTGSAIIQQLLVQPPKDLTLKVFVRSPAKLRKAFPDIDRTTVFKVEITEGTPSDSAALQSCLRGADVIFACIGTNESTPNVSIIHETADAVVKALEARKTSEGTDYKAPTLIQLRSMSVNKTLSKHEPYLLRNMVWFCFYYAYSDIVRACEQVIEPAAARSVLKYIYVDPPALHDPDRTAPPTGHELLMEDGGRAPKGEITYADLGAAFCEAAERREELAGKAVAPSATGPVKLTWGILMGYMVTGIKGRVWG
jgi:hypothetical protein